MERAFWGSGSGVGCMCGRWELIEGVLPGLGAGNIKCFFPHVCWVGLSAGGEEREGWLWVVSATGR